jgi:CubicO group peptidase (beta-lactamase class C family)
MAAHDLCSETFVAGLDPQQTFAESIAPRPGMRGLGWALRYDVDHAKREAIASLLGVIVSRAVYRESWGCVLVHGEERIDNPPEIRTGTVSELPIVDPQTPALKSAIDAAFLEPVQAPHRWTRAVVVVHNGRIVGERYAPGYGVDTPMLGFSMTKSVMNALVGILVQHGKLPVDEPAPITAWHGAQDPRRVITIEDLMRMDSGLALDETGSGFDPSNLMFYDEADMAGYAQRAKVVSAPHTRWRYSSASTHLVARIVRDAVGGDGVSVQRFASRELFEPLGMHHVVMEMDSTGTPVGGHYLYASARDWARFGQLFLDDGVVDGQRLLPKGWVRWSSEPTLGTAYGAGWWTTRSDDPAAAYWRSVGIPADTFFAFGNLGQRIAVIPSEKLVIVRMARAHLPNGDMAGFERLVVDTITSLHP